MRISDWSSDVCSSDLALGLLEKFKTQGFAGEDRASEAIEHPPQPRRIVITISRENRAAGDTHRAEAMENRLVEAGLARHFWIGVQRIIVAVQPIEQSRSWPRPNLHRSVRSPPWKWRCDRPSFTDRRRIWTGKRG